MWGCFIIGLIPNGSRFQWEPDWNCCESVKTSMCRSSPKKVEALYFSIRVVLVSVMGRIALAGLWLVRTEDKFLPILLGKPESPKEAQCQNFRLDMLSVSLTVEIGCMNRTICAEVKLYLCFVFSPHAGLRTDQSLRFWFVLETSHLHCPNFCSREIEAGLLGGQEVLFTHTPLFPSPPSRPPPAPPRPLDPTEAWLEPEESRFWAMHYQLLHYIARDTADSHIVKSPLEENGFSRQSSWEK